MSFILPIYSEPDFNKEPFISAPSINTKKVIHDGVAPDKIYCL